MTISISTTGGTEDQEQDKIITGTELHRPSGIPIRTQVGRNRTRGKVQERQARK